MYVYVLSKSALINDDDVLRARTKNGGIGV